MNRKKVVYHAIPVSYVKFVEHDVLFFHTSYPMRAGKTYTVWFDEEDEHLVVLIRAVSMRFMDIHLYNVYAEIVQYLV